MVTQDQKGKYIASSSYVDSDLILLNMHMQIEVNMCKAKKERPMRWWNVEFKGEGWETQQKKIGGEYWEWSHESSERGWRRRNRKKQEVNQWSTKSQEELCHRRWLILSAISLFPEPWTKMSRVKIQHDLLSASNEVSYFPASFHPSELYSFFFIEFPLEILAINWFCFQEWYKLFKFRKKMGEVG